MYEDLALYIDGEWCQGSTGESEDVINPATEKVLGVLPHASPADLDLPPRTIPLFKLDRTPMEGRADTAVVPM